MFLVDSDVNLIVRNISQNKKSECKKLIKHCVEDYAWNLSICVCACDKDCDISKYLKNWTCMKSHVDDQVVTRDEIVDKSETKLINAN